MPVAVNVGPALPPLPNTMSSQHLARVGLEDLEANPSEESSVERREPRGAKVDDHLRNRDRIALEERHNCLEKRDKIASQRRGQSCVGDQQRSRGLCVGAKDASRVAPT